MPPMQRSHDELLAELCDFLRIPSISSGDGEDADLRRAAAWVCDRVRDAGGTAEIVETARNPLAVGRIACGRPDAPHVLVYGHYDVQTVAPLEAWTSPPFEPTVRDGALYARGASDDKGNFHSLLAPIVDLARAGELAIDVTVVADGEEEIGGDSVVRWLEARTDSFDAAVVFDGSFVSRDQPAITTGVRGIVTGQLRITTGSRDVHSGMYGGAVLNAAHVLSDVIAGTRARDGRLAVALEAGIAPPAAEEVASWASLPDAAAEIAAAGAAPLDARALAEYYERILARPTFDVNAITCRDAAQHRTIIPCEATAAISMRMAAGQDPEAIWAALQAHVATLLPPGAQADFTLWGMAAGCAFDPGAPALRLARTAIAEATGLPCLLLRTGGAIPLLPALARRGVPTVLSGCALPDDDIHAPDEHLRIDQYARGCAMGEAIARAFAALPRA